MHLPFLAKFSIKIASPFYLLQLHPIQILRLGDVEVDLNAVAAGQGHGFDEMGGDELALCGGRRYRTSQPRTEAAGADPSAPG